MDWKEKPLLTYLLIILITATFAYELYLDYIDTGMLVNFIGRYGFSLDGLLAGNWLSLFTSLFIHGGVDHLILNILALYFFGHVVEKELGRKRFFTIYFVSALAGHAATVLSSIIGITSPAIPTIGASAAIFGLMGAAMIVKPLEMVFYPYIIPMPLGFAALIYATYNVLAFVAQVGTGASSEIAFAAHIGGLVAGTYFGLKYVDRKKEIVALFLIVIFLSSLPYFWSALQYLDKINYTAIFKAILPA